MVRMASASALLEAATWLAAGVADAPKASRSCCR
jgi:hypothetical protein